MKNIIILVFCFITQIAYSQLFHENYDWQDQIDITQFETNEAVDLIGFKDFFSTEFNLEGDYLFEYQIVHRIFWINSDDMVEQYNKIYIPIGQGSQLIESKSRVIFRDQTVKEQDKSKIINAKDEEQGRELFYYALEGVTKDCFIEFFYIKKIGASYQGKRVNIQDNFIKKNVEFQLICADHLIFDFKSYNQLKETNIDTTLENKNRWTLSLDKVEKLESEKQSAYAANLQYLVYKLDQNLAMGSKNMVNYNKLAKIFYDYFYEEPDDKVRKKIKNLLKSIRIDNNWSEYDQVRTVEDYVKANFYISESASESGNDLKKVIDNKTGNEEGLMKLFIAVLNELSIKAEIVITSNRYRAKFDTSFEANYFLDQYLVYFPSLDMYTSFSNIESRLGYPPIAFTNNYGLFIKEIDIAGIRSGIGKTKFIEGPDKSKSVDSMYIKVDFEEDVENAKVIFYRGMNGYNATFQNYLVLMDTQDKEQFYEALAKYMGEEVEVLDYKVENDEAQDFGLNAFGIECTLKGDPFINSVGNKYLFKLGELIGPQIEMYADTLRQQNVELEFCKDYKRTIEVEIPAGYNLKGLEDINIHESLEKDGEVLMMFHSYFEQEGNVLRVTADEFYNTLEVNREDYESYRSVINAAANFNKIVLLLEPE